MHKRRWRRNLPRAIWLCLAVWSAGSFSFVSPVVVAQGSLADGSIAMTPEQARQSVQWLTARLLAHAPHQFDGDSGWGDTKSIWSGVKVGRDGWKLTTKRRWREVRHGRWLRYTVSLPDMAAGQASAPAVVFPSTLASAAASANRPGLASPVTIHRVTPVVCQPADAAVAADTTGAQLVSLQDVDGWRVDGTFATPATFDIRVERWNLGVQWFSVRVTGTMNVQLHAQSVIALQADYAEVPPAMQMHVHVEQAKLKVSSLKVDRISKLGGDAAEELGDLAEDTLVKVWLQKENERLTQRLNEVILRNRDDLHWSPLAWLQGDTP